MCDVGKLSQLPKTAMKLKFNLNFNLLIFINPVIKVIKCCCICAKIKHIYLKHVVETPIT